MVHQNHEEKMNSFKFFDGMYRRTFRDDRNRIAPITSLMDMPRFHECALAGMREIRPDPGRE
jgi:hypothetical protein